MKRPTRSPENAPPRHPTMAMLIRRKQMVVYAPRTGNYVIISLLRCNEKWFFRVQRVSIPGVRDRGPRNPDEANYLKWPREQIEYCLSKLEMLPSRSAR